MAVTDKRGWDGFAASITDIDSAVLTEGNNTVLMYPGTYTAPTGLTATDYAFIGVGDRDEIIINGDMTLSNSCSGTITFKNISFVGSNSDVASNTFNVTKSGIGSATLVFENCKFDNAESAVNHFGTLAQMTTTKAVKMEHCDASALNSGIAANANVECHYTRFGSGEWMRVVGTGSPDITGTVTASVGGANVGNMTETVQALIS